MLLFACFFLYLWVTLNAKPVICFKKRSGPLRMVADKLKERVRKGRQSLFTGFGPERPLLLMVERVSDLGIALHHGSNVEFLFWFKATFFLICVKRSKGGPPTKSGHKISKLACLFIGSLWRKKSTFFWHSETMENYIQNFRLFSLPKIYLTFFLTKKSMCAAGPPSHIDFLVRKVR